MAFSLALIILLGLLAGALFEKIKLPGLLGMLLLGVLIGPYALDYLDENILIISEDLRKIALIIILIRAGFGIDRKTLKKIGLPAIRLSFIPVVLEGLIIMLISGYFFQMSRVEAGMLGFIIAAVSPAVIVPSMLSLIDRGKGKEKGIPTLILASASIDDVVSITIFSSFVGMYGGQNINFIKQMLNIPLSIAFGILLGILLSFILLYLFNKFEIRNTKKVLIILASAIMLTTIEGALEGIIPIAGLLGVMVIGFVILEKKQALAKDLSSRFNKLWVLAEVVLFVLVGAQVNISLALDMGFIGILVIIIGLLARSIGVYVSLFGTNLTIKEKGFCIVSFLPKATVQAAIGAVPLSMGVASGELILALAVLSIIITAPIGAVAIKIVGDKVL